MLYETSLGSIFQHILHVWTSSLNAACQPLRRSVVEIAALKVKKRASTLNAFRGLRKGRN